MAKQGLKELKVRLLALLKKEALKKGRFVLSSGKISNYYLDGRIITLTPEGAYLVASIILELIKNKPRSFYRKDKLRRKKGRGKDIDAVGGPTLGADPIVGAVACLSHTKKISLKTFIVRKAAKTHGMQRQIEGPALKKGDKVILLDDVATTGGALIEAKRALDKRGVSVKKAIVIVDRGEGAKENLAKAGLKLESIFTIEDLDI
jgi:orotate phosphoribosyltransferase